MNETVARVWLLNAPFHIDRLYDYFIPGELREAVRSGSFVVVPFGSGNRKERAVVQELAETSEYADLKPILSTLNEALCLTPGMMKLAAFMRDHTYCTYGDAVRTMLPASSITKIGEDLTLIPGKEVPSDLTEAEAFVMKMLGGKKKTTEEELFSALGVRTHPAVSSLAAKGLVLRTLALHDAKSKQIETIFPALPEETLADLLEKGQFRGKKQALLIRSLLETGPMTWETVRDGLSVPRTTLNDLTAAGYLRIEKRTSYRDPYHGKGKGKETPPAVVLSEAQENALNAIRPLICGEPRAALLHGVTGSGKTSVMKKVIDEVLAKGKSVILLVPEIGLTPQSVDYFRGYYGDRIAVVHSMLSEGERFDAWTRMRNGEADLCIGTRSAVFAPFSNLGAIIIDEEQEHTYKSDQSPKYHARDIARFRCAEQGALMLLASATPSPESYEKALSGKYTLVPLTERYGDAKLPEAVLVDTRPDAKEGNLSPIGSVLRAELKERLEKGEQSVLFINRRGYHNFLSCPLCGEAVLCPHCSVSLTYHTVKRHYPEENGAVLCCHWCGYRAPVPSSCPSCGSPNLRHIGYGTQKVEEELHALFPEARVCRMDADTTSMKFSADEMLERFRRGEADILVGTQMVTKGHDFPNVTLVGVLSADASLYLDDFRAGERTFSLITQVIGRAGRGEKPGKALIQTSNPEHPLLALSCSQDYERFFREEEAMRRALTFPPFCDIVVFTFSSTSEPELLNVCTSFHSRMTGLTQGEFRDVPLQIFGPMEAPVYRVNDICRMRILVKCRTLQRTRLLFHTLLAEFSAKTGKKVTVSADVNPSGI